MDKLLKAIKSQIPLDIDGFNCIKTQDILIPYMEIGIECLVRNVTNLNLFFETILKLLEIQITDVLKITNILGVNFEITKEAIIDMVALDFVSVSENKLRITEKGKQALTSQKQIEIKKKYLNRIIINLINGRISDGNDIVTEKANKRSICLVEEINVDRLFLETNYQSINQVFSEQQEKENAFGKNNITKELYKIVDINYCKLVYIKNEIFVYKSDITDEIQIQFESDHNNEYLNCLYKQLKQEVNPCLDYFFEKNRDLTKKISNNVVILDEKLIKNRKAAKDELKRNDNSNLDLAILMERRYSFSDKEYLQYFINSNEMIFDRIIIYSNRINNILTKQVFHELNRIMMKKPVVIIYDKGEFYAKENLQKFLDESNPNLFLLPSENIERTFIFFESSLKIEMEQQIIKAFNKPVSYMKAIIDYNSDRDSVLINILTKFHIDLLILQREEEQNHRKLNSKKKRISYKNKARLEQTGKKQLSAPDLIKDN